MSAIPIGAPGCPELACCTASIARARMALAMFWRSAFAMGKSFAFKRAAPLLLWGKPRFYRPALRDLAHGQRHAIVYSDAYARASPDCRPVQMPLPRCVADERAATLRLVR